MLPELNAVADAQISEIYCNSSPLNNRTESSMTEGIDLPPFQSSSTDSIIVFSIVCQMMTDNGEDNISFTLVTHRRALLDLVSSSAISSSDGEIAWSVWGPSRARWFDTTKERDVFRHITSGQRWVTVMHAEYADHFTMTVYDFNPKNIPGSSYAITKRARFRYVEPYGQHFVQPFSEEVWSELPCTGIESATDYEGMEYVLMDDERIIILPEIPDVDSDAEGYTLPQQTLPIKVVFMGR